MRAFTAIALAASAAFSLFASAAPIAQVDVNGLVGTVEGTVGGVASTVVETVGVVTSGLNLRDEKQSIPVILTELTSKLGPVTAKLRKSFSQINSLI